MNWLRLIYPLRLRSKIYFHFLAHTKLSLNQIGRANLEFAPAQMTALLNTDYGHRQIAWLGYYELKLSRKIASLAKKGGFMVDAGANVGYFSCIWAALNPQNEVHAFEPSPRNISMIKENVSTLLNPHRVQCFDHALGMAAGTLDFDLGPEEQSSWGGLSTAVSSRSIKVKVCRLDDIIPPGKIISVLKIDTEGADTWVLLGAENLLRQKRIKHIFFEANLERMRGLGIQPDVAKTFLISLGYRVHHFGPDEFYATVE